MCFGFNTLQGQSRTLDTSKAKKTVRIYPHGLILKLFKLKYF